MISMAVSGLSRLTDSQTSGSKRQCGGVLCSIKQKPGQAVTSLRPWAFFTEEHGVSRAPRSLQPGKTQGRQNKHPEIRKGLTRRPVLGACDLVKLRLRGSPSFSHPHPKA